MIPVSWPDRKMWIFIIGLFVIALLTGWIFLRQRNDYQIHDQRTRPTAAAVWLLYILYGGLTVFAAWDSFWVLPLNLPLSLMVGVLLLFGGIALFLAGIISFKSIRRVSGMDTSRLVTGGIYRYSRNPQNVGWALFLVGTALVGRSALGLVLATLFWVSFRIYLPVEEDFLERLFGDDYRRYRSSTPRYFGLTRRRATPEDEE